MIGPNEARLLALHEKAPSFLYRAVVLRGACSYSCLSKSDLTPQFIRNELYRTVVEKRIKSSSLDPAIMSSIHILTHLYISKDHSELACQIKRLREKTWNFLAENEQFLGFVREQAIAVGIEAAASDSNWAKNHFLDDAGIFVEAVTRWFDLQ